ncbi:hexosaminidase D-like isoform 2-T2 [Mergus octosetaceus]
MACQRSTKLNLLRLAVLLIVALAGIKFLLRDSLTLELHKHIPKDSGFWGDTGDTSQGAGPRSQALELPVAKITAPRQGPGQQVPKDSSATEMRLVHLDLKGAAPKVSYLEQLFPLLSRLGANGVLIEYEDMFPFKGELEVLRSPYAYSEEDIDWIQQLAELHKLEVVPLVQTFGHVEFILKHEKYQHLREVERFPNSFNPHVPDTLALLKSLLSQVMEKHRRSSWIHIGADEVFHLGEGMDSKSWLSHNRGDVGTMYLKHIKQVLGFIAARYQGLRALMWDDMLRKISTGALRESGIAKQVSPVVWFYAPDFEVEQIGGFMEETRRKVLDVLGFQSLQLEQGTCEGRGAFPGVEIYHMVEQVNGHLKESVQKALEEESGIKGWFSPYHRKHQFGNPRNMESFGSKLLKLHEDWESVVRELRAQLESIYFPDTVEEWMEENVNPYLDQLRDLVRDYRAIIRLNARPKAS